MSLHRDCRRVQSGKFSGGGDRHVVFDTEEVTGSNPVSPTIDIRTSGALFGGLLSFLLSLVDLGSQRKVSKGVPDPPVAVAGRVGVAVLATRGRTW